MYKTMNAQLASLVLLSFYSFLPFPIFSFLFSLIDASLNFWPEKNPHKATSDSFCKIAAVFLSNKPQVLKLISWISLIHGASIIKIRKVNLINKSLQCGMSNYFVLGQFAMLHFGH